MPAKKPGSAKKKKEPTPRKKDAEVDITEVTFTVTIEAKPTILREEHKVAYDSRFSLKFLGEEQAEVSESVTEWENGVWTNEYTRSVDKDYLIKFEDDCKFVVSIDQKSCPFDINGPVEDPTAKSKKKPRKKSADKKKKGQEVDDTPKFHPDGTKVIPPPDDLGDADFKQDLELDVNLAPFLIDTTPVTVTYSNAERYNVPPPCLSEFIITVKVDKYMMSENLARELLPLEITVARAHGMIPKPFPYKKMASYYDPVHVKYEFFQKLAAPPPKPPETPSKPSTPKKRGSRGTSARSRKGANEPKTPDKDLDPFAAVQAAAEKAAKVKADQENDPGAAALSESRPDSPEKRPTTPAAAQPKLIKPPMKEFFTHGLSHAATVHWNDTRVILLGRLDLTALAAYAQSNSFQLEVRDRNVSTEGRKRAQDEKWEGKPVARMVQVSELDPSQEKQQAVEEELPETPKGGKGKRAKSPKTPRGDKKSKAQLEAEEKARQAEAARIEALLVKEEIAAKKRNMYGVASVPLLDIFRGSKTWTHNAPIVPQFQPRGTNLLPFQVKINPYSENAYLSVKFRLARRLDMPQLPAEIPHKFNRMFFKFKYQDTAFHQTITSLIQEANVKAMHMENAPSQDLTTIRLTPEQRKVVGNHDVLTSFSVMDNDYRMFFVEGLALSEPNANAMRRLMEATERKSLNTVEYRLLFDEKITFDHRMYMDFDLSPKFIKLITPLPQIMKDEHLYLNHNIPPRVYLVLQQLQQLQQLDSMHTAKLVNMFPQVVDLLSMEKRYGAFVSDDDLEGYNPARVRNSRSARLRAKKQASQTSKTNKGGKKKANLVKKLRPQSALPAVDSINLEYLAKREEHSARRSKLRFVRDNKQLAIANKLVPYVGGYKHVPNMFEQLAEDYNWELDTYRMAKEEKAEARRTKIIADNKPKEKGFRLLDKHDIVKKRQHRLHLHPSRVEELTSPWVPASKVKPLKSDTYDPDFNALPQGGAGKAEFGYPGNQAWGQSVFYATEDQIEAEEYERTKGAKEEFRRKLVVDDVVFRAHRSKRNVTILDKVGPMLAGGPKKQALKYRNRMKASRKITGPPNDIGTSILTREPYTEGGVVSVGRSDSKHDADLHSRDFQRTAHEPSALRNWKPAIKPLSDTDITRMRSLRIKPSRPASAAILSPNKLKSTVSRPASAALHINPNKIVSPRKQPNGNTIAFSPRNFDPNKDRLVTKQFL